MQIFVFAKWRRLDNDLFQQLDELDWEISSKKGFGCDRNIRIRKFRKGSSDNLSRGLMNSVECKAEAIPELMAVNIAANEDLGPQPRLETLNEIVSLLLEHRVVVGDSNKFIVKESFMDPTSPLQE